MKTYAIVGVSLAIVGIGVVIVITNQRKTARTQAAIRNIGSQFDDGVITSEEAPGLAEAIRTGAIHTDAYRWRPGRDAST